MKRFCAGAFALAAIVGAAPALAQGIPGTRAYVEGHNGWQAIRDARHEAAAAAFAAALDAEPRDPSLHLGAGLAAQHPLERAPSLTAASLLLADILYRGSDVAAAIQAYEGALMYAPADKTVITRLETLRREAAVHSDFFESRGAHVTVLFEGQADAGLAARVIETLEATYWRVITALSIYPERTITVVLYTQEQFRDITRSPQWAAAAYDGRIRLPVRGADADLRELERVLTHEFTHALIQSLAPRGVPMWMHEGLALAFEPDGAAWSGEELSNTSSRLPLPQLVGSFATLSVTEARLAYAQSAAMVRALFDLSGPLAVGALLQDIVRGDTFPVASERRMLMAHDAFIGGLEVAP